MKRVTVSIPTSKWGTLNTKYPASSIFVREVDFTEGSKNFDTSDRGAITKRGGGVDYNPSSLTSTIKDQFEAIFSDGVHHLLVAEGGRLSYTSGDQVFNNVNSGYSATSNFEFDLYADRVYFGNGVNSPQVYDRVTSYGGVTYTAPRTKVMGCQIPGSAVTFAADSAGGNVPAGSHTYKVTYLYYGVEESNGSTSSAVRTVVNPNNTVNLTAVPIGGYGVTTRKIYRDDNDGNYLLVGSISDNTTATFADTAALGTSPIPIDNSLPPNFSLIVTHDDRVWLAGISGDPSTVWYSDAGTPDIVQSSNFIVCNTKDFITGLVIYQGRPIVFSRNSMGQILGKSPDQFSYSPIPSSIGCVDCRSIQIRVIDGVPTLVWLSDKGIYQYNGSSIDYLSDPIEDTLNFNIQQAVLVKGRASQTNQTDFQAGTASPGIDLTSYPGEVTTPNPERSWQTYVDWTNGLVKDNLVTEDGSGTIKVPTRFMPDVSSGSFNGCIQSGSNITLNSTAAFNGTNGIGSTRYGINTHYLVAQQIVVPRAGILSQLSLRLTCDIPSGTFIGKLAIWTDNAGVPGILLQEKPVQSYTTFSSGTQIIFNSSVSCYANQILWIGFSQYDVTSGSNSIFTSSSTSNSSLLQLKYKNSGISGSSWTPLNIQALGWGFTFTYTRIAGSGQWTSISLDTYSLAAKAATLRALGSTPANTTRTIKVQRSSDNFTWTDNDGTVFNGNGPHTLAIGSVRYWRIIINLTTTDNVFVPTYSAPELRFLTQAEWNSEVLDHTTDITVFNLLSMVSSIPADTTVKIATSADGVTFPDGFVVLGSVVVRRYSKIQIILNTDVTNATTPIVSQAILDWTLVSNLISSIIDTRTTNSGWDITQIDSVTNGGTLVLKMRSASTTGGLPGATWYTVVNGDFPGVPVNRYVQWQAILTSTANHVPEVFAFTINWFISSGGQNIRVASLFFNIDNTYNNLMLVLDEDNTWKIYEGVNANTMSLFFNDAYYGLSTAGKLVKFLQSNTDRGIAIEMDIRTKAFDFTKDAEFPTLEKTKILKKLYLVGKNTGAVYTVYASYDNGATYIPLYDPETGLTTYTTSTDDLRFIKKFVTKFDLGQVTAGNTIIVRIHENTAAPAEIQAIKAEVYIREGDLR